MKKDNPDTFPETEHTRWLETHAEDVFLPSVRVQINWRDVESAVENGGIVAAQAHSLWATWAMPGSPTRLGTEGEAPVPPAPSQLLESSWAANRPMPPTRAVRAQTRQPVGRWFAAGLVLGVALVWGFALLRGISLLG
ncbi:hypothetical protein [Hydrogenophaga sp. PAMC20947]|uniref:hypothetical protein n=1 Tax=Hydrogenophaga sp. PAMC20947 TaxID=2565558 RepID=UPI00109DDDFC|nr:hypothetical protein [Hydrogenophaga sp. PAMC20947]QCB46270.1 hypothetical protein E5678_09695 [Hydrogenophaga sp. PAMC20947]